MNKPLIWDNHACMPLRPGEVAFLDQLSVYRSIDASVVSLNVGFDALHWSHTLKMLATFRDWVQQHPEHYRLIDTVEDVSDARASNRLGIVFDIEGGSAVDDSPELVALYYALGVRWMLIAYNNNNALGGGCQDDDQGLTRYGKRVIDAMQEAGMVVCCSHTGLRTARDVLDYAQSPVIFSHSNPRALWDHPRNIPDDMITACAATGGVVGINGLGLFLGDNDNRTATICQHIDYVAQLVGPEHVGLALDYVFDPEELEAFVQEKPEFFPPSNGYTRGFNMVEPARIPEIVETLSAMGWDEPALRGLLGENHLRVASEVWR